MAIYYLFQIASNRVLRFDCLLFWVLDACNFENTPGWEYSNPPSQLTWIWYCFPKIFGQEVPRVRSGREFENIWIERMLVSIGAIFIDQSRKNMKSDFLDLYLCCIESGRRLKMDTGRLQAPMCRISSFGTITVQTSTEIFCYLCIKNWDLNKVL